MAMDDRAETQRIEERLPQGTDEWLARPRLSTTSRGTITPVAILQPLSAPVGDVVMYTGPLQPMGQLHGIGREFGGGTQPNPFPGSQAKDVHGLPIRMGSPGYSLAVLV